MTIHLFRLAHGHRHYRLMVDAISDMIPGDPCIGAVPKALINRTAVDVLLVQRVHSDALRFVTYKVIVNFPFPAVLAYHCNPIL